MHPFTQPTPQEIKAKRESLGLTQKQAAELIYKKVLSWNRYERDNGKIKRADWEMFLIKTKDMPEAEKPRPGVKPKKNQDHG